jgi:hypothetical protein
MFARQDKPFVIAGKETVLRAMTVKLYESEINDFYAKQEMVQLSVASCIDVTSFESTKKGIRSLVCGTLGIETLGSSDDIFAAGLDSLSVFNILASLRVTHKTNDSQASELAMTASTIYANPTIEKLSNAIYGIINAEFLDSHDTAVENADHIKALVDKYTASFPARTLHSRTDLDKDNAFVILTGSTGSLGSYLLDVILSKEHITRIFCLNRSKDGQAKQTEGNLARGLETNWSSDRVEFLHADLSEPNFGLEAHKYSELLQHTTHIIREKQKPLPKSTS